MRSTSGTTGRSPASPTAILAIILISYFMILMDNSVIFTGLPSIRVDLALSPAALSWVQDAYTLVFGGLLEAVALPMLLIGAGQGLAFAPLTSSGIAGVPAGDAGAASGLVNTAHQLGMALGLGILVAVSAQAGGLDGAAAVTAHVSAALTGSTVLLAMALLVVVLVIVPARRTLSPAPVTTNLVKEAAA